MVGAELEGRLGRIDDDDLGGRNRVNSAQSGNVVQTRPICLYPEVAYHKGRGDFNDASNLKCGDRKDRD